ncbi:hypothetical protein Hanom_Chr05g00432631 [Helianthus anomalus]
MDHGNHRLTQLHIPNPSCCLWLSESEPSRSSFWMEATVREGERGELWWWGQWGGDDDGGGV